MIMKIQKIAKEKLVEKNIEWEQVYTEKTLFLKEQFEDVVGPGSYFRFEGKDLDSDSEYYCIIGPAKIHDPIAKFFAGVRKLPATYSAGGKYFDSMDSAASYAQETWGVPRPRSLKPYTSSSLHGIKKRVEEWKAKHEKEGEGETKKSSCNDKGCFWKRAAEDDFQTTQFSDDIADDLARKEQERTPVERQRDYYPKERAALRSYDSMMENLYPSDGNQGATTPELDRELLKNIIGVVMRDTGVSSQTGESSWDVRSTLTHQDVEGKTVLEDLLPLLEFDGKNVTIRGMKEVFVKQPNGTRKKTYRIPVYDAEDGKWKDKYLTRDVQQAFTQAAHKAVELMHKGVYLDPSEEADVDVFGVDDKTETQGNLDTNTEEDVGGGFNFGFSDDDLGSDEDLASVMDDMGIDFDMDDRFSSSNQKNVFSNTLQNLIRIAKDVDDKGNHKHAEEIHKVIRKYIKRAK